MPLNPWLIYCLRLNPSLILHNDVLLFVSKYKLRRYVCELCQSRVVMILRSGQVQNNRPPIFFFFFDAVIQIIFFIFWRPHKICSRGTGPLAPSLQHGSALYHTVLKLKYLSYQWLFFENVNIWFIATIY